jgi:flagellar motility protein MotE (MotC chaperone)
MHLDRIQAALTERVEALKESRDLMLKELAEQLQKMNPDQVAAELRVLDDESAAMALAKLTTTKRTAVLQRMDADRARTLGRMATNYASKNRKG